MGLVGAVLTTSISLIVPALMAFRLWGDDLSGGGRAAAGAVIVLGLLCMGVGATSGFESLRAKLAAAGAAAAVA